MYSTITFSLVQNSVKIIVNGKFTFERKTCENYHFWLPKRKPATHMSMKLPMFSACPYSTFSRRFS